MRKTFKLSTFIYLTIIITWFSSCKVYHNIPYFKDVSDSTNESLKLVTFKEPTIQYDDMLSVVINTLDNQSSGLVNMPISSAMGGSSSGSSAIQSIASGGLQSIGGAGGGLSVPTSSNYRVDKTGILDFPLIGKMNVLGFTTSKLRDSIQQRISEYYKNPVVDVRFTNFRVTVMGEVLRPSTYIFNNEMVSVIDAIGMAGDLTIFGKRENVMLMRDSGNQKLMVRLNLNSKKFIQSPYFYLKQNDVIYVEPKEEKIANLDASQAKIIPIISAVLSVLIILATRVK